MMARWLGLGLCILLAAGCDSPLEYEDGWLDGPAVLDPSLNDPGYRLSTRPGMTAADRSRPVIVAVHGFTASTFEWSEFRSYAERDGRVLVSLVLLGGHGRTVEAFGRSRWPEWGAPILEEVQSLVAQGYTHISIAASSTGGALVLEQLATGGYSAHPPRHIFFIDPIVVPYDKSLTLIPLLKHLIGAVQTEGTEEEARHWYTNRPTSALAELNALIGRVRTQLARGVTLPAAAQATVYKTTGDRTADPVSALLIHRGLRTSEGARVEVQMLDSKLHVFTRLSARRAGSVTAADEERQRRAFEEMIGKAGG
jgi:carboxylesterase